VTYLNIAGTISGQTWDKVYAFGYDYTQQAIPGYDKAYLTGSTGDDTFTGVGTPRTTYPSGMGPGISRLTGAGYLLQTAAFKEVYANLGTGNKDVANLYDSTGAGTDTFWGNLHDAVLSDGTLDLTNGNLLAAAGYYYRVSGFDNAGLDPLQDTVNLFGSTTGGTNTRRIITPIDFALTFSGSWTGDPWP